MATNGNKHFIEHIIRCSVFRDCGLRKKREKKWNKKKFQTNKFLWSEEKLREGDLLSDRSRSSWAEEAEPFLVSGGSHWPLSVFFCVCLLQLAVGSCCTRKKDIKLRPPAEASGSHLLCTLPVFLRPPVGQQLLRFNAIGFLFWLFRVFQQLLDPNIFQTTRNRFF